MPVRIMWHCEFQAFKVASPSLTHEDVGSYVANSTVINFNCFGIPFIVMKLKLKRENLL